MSSFSPQPNVQVAPPRAKRNLLVVEDNPGDVWLVREAIQMHSVPVDMHLLHDGEEAMEYIHHLERDLDASYPDLILLDLNLPKRSGKEVLRFLKASDRLGNIPVIVMTSSDSPQDRHDVDQLGAVSYFRKPPDYQQFLRLGDTLNNFLY